MKTVKLYRFGNLIVLGTVFCLIGPISGIAQDTPLIPLPNPASEESAIESLPLTIERATEIALANHPSISERSADADRFRGLRWDATRKPNPILGYLGSEIGDNGTAGLQGFYYSQEYVTANKLGLNNQVRGWDVETARWRTEVQRRRVMGDVRQRFYEILAARQSVEILTVMDKVQQDGVDVTQRLVDAGQVGKGDLLQARLRMKNNRLQLENARIREATARQSLAVVLGMGSHQIKDVAGSLEDPLPKFEFETKLQALVAVHPIVESARAEMVRHQWSIQREQVEPIPNVRSQFGVQYNAATDDTVVNLQLGLELPKHNRNVGKISAACAEYVQASHKVRRLELALKDQFVNAFREYSLAMQTLDQTETELLPDAIETLNTAQNLYQNGEMSYLGLLNAQQTYVNTLLNLNTARLRAWQSVALIETGLLTGGLTLTEN